MTTLQVVLKDACLQHGDVNFRNHYSGRGMYGRNCVGITGSMSDCQTIIASVIVDMSKKVIDIATEVDDSDSASHKDFQEAEGNFIDAIHKLTAYEQDNMGYDVILYWRDLAPIEDEDDEEEQGWTREELERGRAM